MGRRAGVRGVMWRRTRSAEGGLLGLSVVERCGIGRCYGFNPRVVEIKLQGKRDTHVECRCRYSVLVSVQ